jgi:hypothetical protein
MCQYAAAVWRGLAAHFRPRTVAGHERRQGVRYASAAHTLCRPAGNEKGEPWPATVRNVSLAGIGLLLCCPLSPGTLVHVDLPGLGCRLLACVAHSTPVAENAWSVGCSFLRDLSDEEMRSLL